MFDIYATQEGYAHHLIPVWLALSPRERGRFYGHTVNFVAWLKARGVYAAEQLPARTDRPILTAGIMDYRRAEKTRPPALAYMEHGCGQSYAGDGRMTSHPAYAGGDGRDGCSLILAPNAYAAERWAGRYPTTPVHTIGATRVLTPPEDAGRSLLVVSFHWDSNRIPEMRSAWGHYRDGLGELARSIPLAIHAHPRARDGIRAWAHGRHIEFIEDIEEVAQRATVYAVDNSSTLWEMGRTRPVIALDAPWYRRDVHHGLRFWSHVPGPRVEDCDGLGSAALRLLQDGESDDVRAVREDVVRAVIPSVDGARTASMLVAEWSSDPHHGVLATEY